MSHAFTNGAVNKPAKLSSTKLPGRTLFLELRGTFLNNPAGFYGFVGSPCPGDKKMKLPLYVGRHPAPTLLVTVHGLNGCSEQVRQLLLSLFQFLAKKFEFFAVQGDLPDFSFG